MLKPPDVVVVLDEEEVVVEEVVEELVNVGLPVVPPPVVVVTDADPVPPSDVTEIVPLPEIEELVPFTLIVAEFLPSIERSDCKVGATTTATVSAVKAALSNELLVNAKAKSASAHSP